MAFTKSMHTVAKVLGIDIDDHPRLQEFEEPLKNVVSHSYREQEPTVGEYLRSLRPEKKDVANYVCDLFPSAQWIPRYNLRWLLGDVIAGLTIGFVVVPQAMAYALLAQLSPEYGLYTSFVGAATYWIFGTSKDIVIGTTAVGSLLVGTVITSVEDHSPGLYSRTEIAKTLSFIIGTTLLLVGLLRLGWLIEFIPYVPISAFVTAASITIISTQLSTALGISDINTRDSPYQVLLSTFRGLPRTQLDAAIGLSCIVVLFIVRDVCAKLEVKQPSRKRLWTTISSLRLTFAMLFYTLVSFLVNRTHKDHPKFRLVGKIDVGFRQAGPPKLDGRLVSLILPELPAMMIILIIEHIAIAKSFGRTFGYTVIPSQEILAQGTANFLGPFVGGYACTGSFGASAVLSKAGVRTPLAGLFSALVLLLALYALTEVFFFIPKAALAGLIIHSVLNLPTPPKSLYRYWQLSPFELLIWIVGVSVAIFTDLETSIYCTIALSLALLLVRLARTKGRFLGRVRIGRVAIDVSLTTQDDKSIATSSGVDLPYRDAYLPEDREDAANPAVDIESSHPGVFIFRFTEGFNYVNQGQQMARLLRHVLANTRAGSPDDGVRPSDRLWNDPGPTRASAQADAGKPILRAMVLDCSSVNNTDITSIQGLIDARNFLDKHAFPAIVEWHFAHVNNRWTRRALATAGFGFPIADKGNLAGNWAPVYTVSRSFAGATPDNFREEAKSRVRAIEVDEERRCRQPVTKQEFEAHQEPIGEEMHGCESLEDSEQDTSQSSRAPSPRLLYGMDRPFFHIDIVEAVDAAVRDAERADMRGA